MDQEQLERVEAVVRPLQDAEEALLDAVAAHAELDINPQALLDSVATVDPALSEALRTYIIQLTLLRSFMDELRKAEAAP